MAEVYKDGKFIGTVENAKDFVQKVREDRRKNKIPHWVNISLNESSNEVQIEMNSGRARRPLMVIKDGKTQITEEILKKLQKNEISWSDLIKQGLVEYLDTSEEENANVAFMEADLTKEHTHMEITPISMFSLTTAQVPYSNHTLSTRVHGGSKSQKQAVGLYTANYQVRIDTDVSILHNPQIPVVQSMVYGISEMDKHPAGQNVVLAVLSYEGYNMEDGVLLNKSSIEYGLGRSSYFRPAGAEELRYSGGLVDEISIPDKEVKGYRSERDYQFLEDDGIIHPEAKVKEGDVVIGKTSPPRFLSGMDEYNLASNVRRESSIAMQHGEEGIVDFVMITENEEGNKLVQVRLRDQRIPEIGDKFASRHGQKGVVGIILPDADMPFTSRGVTPDIIFSPHGIPSRMTVSHLLELIAGKTGSLSGRYVDGTTFSSEPEEAIREELLSLGFREDGTETLYNGMTGRMMKAKIYIGDMYYLRLKHMVANKLHSRARGPIQLLTRQPTEGRAKEGGLRLGEMEKDCFVAHGASLLLKERFDSDKTIVPICEECGLVAVYDRFKNKSYCPMCGEDTVVSNVEISYAFKLMLDELKSIGIYPKLELKDKY